MASLPAHPPATGRKSDAGKCNSNSVTLSPESISGFLTNSSFWTPTFRPLAHFPWYLCLLLPQRYSVALPPHQSVGYVRLFHISMSLNIAIPSSWMLFHPCSLSPLPNFHHLLRRYLNSIPWEKSSPNPLVKVYWPPLCSQSTSVTVLIYCHFFIHCLLFEITEVLKQPVFFVSIVSRTLPGR